MTIQAEEGPGYFLGGKFFSVMAIPFLIFFSVNSGCKSIWLIDSDRHTILLCALSTISIIIVPLR